MPKGYSFCIYTSAGTELSFRVKLLGKEIARTRARMESSDEKVCIPDLTSVGAPRSRALIVRIAQLNILLQILAKAGGNTVLCAVLWRMIRYPFDELAS
jgi:hypothetical protein